MQDLPLKSSIDGIEWPTLPERPGPEMLAILFQLEQSQWWPAEQILERQFHQLGLLLAHAVRTVPFYRERLSQMGIAPNAPVTPHEWSRIPLLRRSDVQGAGDTLLSNQLPKSHGGTFEVFTSGSTGMPIRAIRSNLWVLFWGAFVYRSDLWYHRDMRGKLASIRESGKGKAPYPHGTVASNWSQSSFSEVFDTGPSVGLNTNCSVEQHASWLQEQDPDYLLTFPSIAQRLADYCLENGIQLPNLRHVTTISEILRPETRAACREAWGVPVFDMYSTREAGYIALQCPEHEHYHIQAEGTLVEVLNADGRPCTAGEVGQVVVTPLHNFAMPLIRYDVGDYAEVGEPCPCGRGLPVLRRILGRRRNMLVMPSGEQRWPFLTSSENIRTLVATAPIRQYQFVQKSAELIELRLAVERDLTPAEENGLRRWVREKFGHPFEVGITYHDEIPRTAAGKYEDFISEVR